ncbi:hypothetical protein [Streptomyces sp. ISL-100]|uniref:hypothetical protein n=1 Tax=Streptomyces sp. ISL-100 TaxID=2819173 RepID=UPI001BEC3F63|nr:hypothetical protein [Streptomyces sp. ISL-100]MBT2398455.1 hypothetical protein [Streptomyces sp. ISL-100]
MKTAPTHRAPATGSALSPAPAPRWARRAAHAIALCAVPSGLWRLAMACGVYVGYSDEILREKFGLPGFGGVAYLVTLVVVGELAALLPLLLVTDRWRLSRPRTVAGVAWGCAIVANLFALSQVVLYFAVESRTYMSATANAVTGLCYAPLFAIPPLFAAVTWSYWKRHRA